VSFPAYRGHDWAPKDRSRGAGRLGRDAARFIGDGSIHRRAGYGSFQSCSSWEISHGFAPTLVLIPGS